MSAVRYTAAIASRARALYLSGLSCRQVAATLALEVATPPPAKWVEKLVRRAGIVRSKTDGQRLFNGHRNGRDYFALEREARQLLGSGVSLREITRRLGIGRATVHKRLGPHARDEEQSDAVRDSYWRRNPGRRALRLRAAQMRLGGMSLHRIAGELGQPVTTVWEWIRRDVPIERLHGKRAA